MEPLKVYWKKVFPIPGTQWTISGYSRSAFRTAFYIKELDILLDAGPHLHRRPKQIFITHTHADHIAELPYTLINNNNNNNSNNNVDESERSEDPINQSKPIIYAPEEGIPFIRGLINASFSANEVVEGNYDDFFNYQGLPHGTAKFRTTMKKTPMEVLFFDCDHSIPTKSFGFAVIKSKLKEEYRKLPGKEIGQLRKAGVEITYEAIEKKLAYVCDTSITVLESEPIILEYPVIFIECTFLYNDEEEVATKKKHIHWNQLEPYIKTHPHILFVLIHFSLKYKDEEIQQYLEEKMESQNINNVHLWLTDLVE